MNHNKHSWVFTYLLPLAAIAIILIADSLEGPKTAYIGVLAVVPMLAAVFGTPLSTALVSIITFGSATVFGLLASDGNVPAQNVRLMIIAIVGIIAVWASRQRQKSETERAQIEIEAARAEVLEKQSNTDLLTGLLNRRGLESALKAGEKPNYFIMIDVDGLKRINDSYGHATGDEYLMAVAGRLGNAFNHGSLVCRWGGDEFVVLSQSSAENIREVVAEGIARVLQRDVLTESGLIPCAISVGVTQWQERLSIQEVMMAADQAMFEAKKLPAGQSTVFDF
jgi:diguanylate cyclase (GGDEF)-like protein